MIKVDFTEYFDVFLKQFDTDKQELIKKIILDYCDHKKLLPRPKPSPFRKDIQKVALHEAGVVIFYCDFGDMWLILTGVVIHDRAA